jgi:anti-sigma-K factor RskA
MSTDLHTLSGAYAIDALSPDEAEEFRKHLEDCPACRDEVRELQEAAGIMGASEAVAPPTALKARVLAAADRSAQLPPVVRGIKPVRPRWIPGLVAAAVAAVLVVVGAFGLKALDTKQVSAVNPAVAAVFGAPDAHRAIVDTSNGGKVSVATSKKLGEMAVDTTHLPKLSKAQVYQVWQMTPGERPASAGLVINTRQGQAMGMPSTGTRVAITIEPSGGSPRPTSSPIVTVDPGSV